MDLAVDDSFQNDLITHGVRLTRCISDTITRPRVRLQVYSSQLMRDVTQYHPYGVRYHAIHLDVQEHQLTSRVMVIIMTDEFWSKPISVTWTVALDFACYRHHQCPATSMQARLHNLKLVQRLFQQAWFTNHCDWYPNYFINADSAAELASPGRMVRASLPAHLIPSYALLLSLCWDCTCKLQVTTSVTSVAAAASDFRSNNTLAQKRQTEGPLQILMEIISAYAEEDLPAASRSTWWPNMGWVLIQTNFKSWVCCCHTISYLKTMRQHHLHLFIRFGAPQQSLQVHLICL